MILIHIRLFSVWKIHLPKIFCFAKTDPIKGLFFKCGSVYYESTDLFSLNIPLYVYMYLII